MKIKITSLILLAFLSTSCCDTGCSTITVGKNIPITEVPLEQASTPMQELIKRGKAAVDSIKAPIIGTAATTLKAERPESSLTNFAADALLAQSRIYSKENIDLAITNKGGLRSDLHEGVITFGDVYNVFPFENTLVTLTLNGEQLLQLFNEIAKVGGEAISGARMEIIRNSNSRHCAKLTIDNTTLPGNDDEWKKREYRIATSDYLSQGNDGLVTLAQGSKRKEYTVTIRQLMIDYIANLHKQDKAVDAATDGRIKIIDTDKR
ncbi:MAG: 5'-nucleotidase C-terminal domain-containing protein [Bacteroidaceae bacterium]|nr:5'-nucleotidase C-terminal domain-containing protein [Bacteroidaceae bacterium]